MNNQITKEQLQEVKIVYKKNIPVCKEIEI